MYITVKGNQKIKMMKKQKQLLIILIGIILIFGFAISKLPHNFRN